MATSGHVITLVGIIFFFLMLIDSHVEKKVAIHKHLGIPRWHKRVQYYIYKIRILQLNSKKTTRVPRRAASATGSASSARARAPPAAAPGRAAWRCG